LDASRRRPWKAGRRELANRHEPSRRRRPRAWHPRLGHRKSRRPSPLRWAGAAFRAPAPHSAWPPPIWADRRPLTAELPPSGCPPTYAGIPASPKSLRAPWSSLGAGLLVLRTGSQNKSLPLFVFLIRP